MTITFDSDNPVHASILDHIARIRELRPDLSAAPDGEVIDAALEAFINRQERTKALEALKASSAPLEEDDDPQGSMLGERSPWDLHMRLVFEPPDDRSLCHADDELLAEASSNHPELRSRAALVDAGLRALIGREATERLAGMHGCAPNFAPAPRSAWHKLKGKKR